jgi:hypothetical protein
MKKTGPVAIKVALYGMDPRSYKTMELYLKGPCRGIAEVVAEQDAQIDIIDADFATAGEILEARRQQTPDRPIVLLSLQHLKIADTHFIQKPVTVEQITTVLTDLTRAKKDNTQTEHDVDKPPELNQSSLHQIHSVPESVTQAPQKKRTAFEANEGGYTAFLGNLADIDFDDPKQWTCASFDPKVHLLSYVLSAYKIACHQNHAQQLNSMWKPLMIFPDSRKIWLDADDKQLRVFAGMEHKLFANTISLSPIDEVENVSSKAADKFQDMDAFIWKLSIWTSKGRFPANIDPNLPLFLKQWPNFTRLMLIPDAMRIAALLLKSPRSAIEIVKVLQVKPQYVFAFITACQSLGILGQCQRQADFVVSPEPPKPNQKQSLFSKILHKLRGE